jgi:hypothetical protein
MLRRGSEIDQRSSYRRNRYYRDRALGLVIVSAFLVSFIGFAVEQIVWHYDIWARQSQMELLGITRGFLHIFGGYGHTSLWYVVAILWLPMPYAFARCYARSLDDAEFALRFLYAFIWCWLLVLLGLAVISIPLLAPLIILLQDVIPRSRIGEVIPWLALGLTFATLVAAMFELLHRLKRDRRTRMNRCGECGYDLRGSADRCPECGHRTPRAHTP